MSSVAHEPLPRERAPLLRRLEALVRRWHRPEHIGFDPVGFVRRYDDPADREAAGLIAASLAFGQVKTIAVNVDRALGALGPRPAVRLRSRGAVAAPRGFRHRWIGEEQLAALFRVLARTLRHDGSLESAVCKGMAGAGPPGLLQGMARWVDAMHAIEPLSKRLLPSPSGGSACKRLMLYLRWMVRSDAIDPGGWTQLMPSDLIMPLDVHIFRLAIRAGWTRRRQADLRAALEVTASLRELSPCDPLRYDFALTRWAMAQGRGADNGQRSTRMR